MKRWGRGARSRRADLSGSTDAERQGCPTVNRDCRVRFFRDGIENSAARDQKKFNFFDLICREKGGRVWENDMRKKYIQTWGLLGAIIVAWFFWFDPVCATYWGAFLLLALATFLWAYLFYLDRKKIKLERENKQEKKSLPGILLSDKEVEHESENKLWEQDSDIRPFAEGILNGGSSDPIVFGLDAPWGSGKSSFLNLCREYVWKKEEEKKNLVYFKFSPPVARGSAEEVTRCFVEQLREKLRSTNIADALVDDLGDWLNLLKEVQIFGFTFRSPFRPKSTEEVLKSIERHAKKLDRKMLIVVDDLDRMYLEEIKAILSVIRNVFLVDNFLFIVCYDSCAINTADTQFTDLEYEPNRGEEKNPTLARVIHRESDNQKINAYLEKFVQIKKTLIPRREKLLEYCKRELRCRENERGNWEEGFEGLFSTETYSIYQGLIGDMRKVKRVLNFLNLSGIIRSNVSETDIDPASMLKLIVVYINYPHIFRDIYVNEMNGLCGFVSLTGEAEKETGIEKMENQNSARFWEYLRKHSDQERNILHDIFCFRCAKGKCLRLERDPTEYGISDRTKEQDFEEKSPMFNGGFFGGLKNLEDYLKRIVDQEELPLWRYFAFHRKRVHDVISGVHVADIFSRKEYDIENGEHVRKMFFDACVEVSKEKDVDEKKMLPVIEYGIENSHQYSLVNIEGKGVSSEGIRQDVFIVILKILENLSVSFPEYLNPDYPPKADVGEMLFGKKNLFGRILRNGDNSILSIENARLVAHYVGNRGRSLVYLPDAVEKYLANKQSVENVKSPESAQSPKEWMVQRIFEYFDEIFIVPKRNWISDALDDKTKNDLFGEYREYIEKFAKENDADLKQTIGSAVRRRVTLMLRGFLGKEVVEDIRKRFSDYLFSVCFDSATDEGKRCFLYCMLALLESDFSETPTFRLEKLQKELFDEVLVAYWQKNRESIKEYVKKNPDAEMVWVGEYGATYGKDLPSIFSALDGTIH